MHSPLYSAAEQQRRDASRWTLVQGVLAPLQFVAFGISLWLVIQFLVTGQHELAATLSIVIKTLFLYAIMITGSLWEHDVFGRYLFVRQFFWEDVVSMVVLALHTAYLIALLTGLWPVRVQMTIALLGYAAYLINAGQFLWKFRLARRHSVPLQQHDIALAGATK